MPSDGTLALIPARSGSKGIPNKNIQLFRGKPLLAHSIEHARSAASVERIIVSTDSEEYASIAREYGAEVPFLRPAKYATDEATDLDVFRHTLTFLRDGGELPQICVHLRPTHPIRNAADIDRAVNILNADDSVDSVRSIVPCEQTPLKMWWMGEDGALSPVAQAEGISEAYNAPRQILPKAYRQNASIDVLRSRLVLERNTMTGERIFGLTVEGAYDIDNWTDWRNAECAATLSDNGPRELVFDIDGIIASIVPDNDYKLAKPMHETIALINRLEAAGHRIILHTARGSKTGIDWRSFTERQLRDWGVRYHGLFFGKPAGHAYIDDKMIDLETLSCLLN